MLAPNLVASQVDGGRIAENIAQFVRLLRAAGLPVGPEKTIRATEAVLAAGLDDPKILYWALHAVLVNRRSEREIFNQAFLTFWRDPGYLEQMLSVMLPQLRTDQGQEQTDSALSRRMSESLFKNRQDKAPSEPDRLDLEAHETWSGSEVLRTKDFEQMGADELRAVRRAIAQLALPLEHIRTRRFEPAAHGNRLDLRRMLRETGGKGADHLRARFRRPRWRRPPVVVLCDISGSMDTYARVLLHFLYALTNDRDRVHAFLFGTRLTNITRTLKSRDPDVAVGKAAKDVLDWSGGTRIGACLDEFNRRWARRVLGQNALVLLFTDGLDRDDAEGLDVAARRLSASCRRLVWLNPLMRYDGYAPLAAGAKSLSRHVHEMRSCHNMATLRDLAESLGPRGRRAAVSARRR